MRLESDDNASLFPDEENVDPPASTNSTNHTLVRQKVKRRKTKATTRHCCGGPASTSVSVSPVRTVRIPARVCSPHVTTVPAVVAVAAKDKESCMEGDTHTDTICIGAGAL